jgi:sarcosine oxidase
MAPAATAQFDVDTLVVGAGPVGASAARHLSLDRAAGSVAVVGPTEPENPHRHGGIHGAWHDEGRLTRVIAGDDVWAHLAQRSIARYPQIHEQGGHEFHRPGSVLYLFDDADAYERHRAVGQRAGAAFSEVGGDPGRFPYLTMPAGTRALLETGEAGVINPRLLVANQLHAARANGASVIRDVVHALHRESDAVVADLGGGVRLRCRRAVVAAGAYVNAFGLLPRAAPVVSIGITAHFFEVDEALLPDLAGMPGMVWFDDPSGGTFVYTLPPIRYPDGRWWFKVGGHRESGPLSGRNDIDHWHRTAGGDMGFEAVQQWVAERVPVLAGRGRHSVGCVITESPSAMPVIADAVPGRLVVATGCGGAAAKSCDEIGRIAAVLAVHGEWDSPLDRDLLSGR